MANAGLGKFYTDATVTTPAFDVLKGVFAKTNWNHELINLDASRGIHNPSFSFDVLSATVAAAAQGRVVRPAEV